MSKRNVWSCEEASTKEGFLMKQTWSFQRWRRRYFKLRGHTLYYAKDAKAVIFDEIDLTDLSFAECSIKNINNSFQVITPYRRLVLAADSRREMEEWISALKAANSREFCEDGEPHDLLSGHHHWYATSHARPTYCNVCRDALSGVTSHGLSCEVCKCKVHKRCAVKAINNCKWTTLASIGKDIIEDRDGNITMPHQWMEGNLPVSAKCAVCDRTCGSVLRLQDWRCLWCRATVHTACRPSHPVSCPLGPSRVSVVPPTALHSVGSDDAWEAVRPQGCSPLLVFVNSKSGENQGVKFLRRFKQLLNPAQVFDLISSGPGLGLGLFRHFDPFRILVCSGDGSVGWVLSEIDRLHMHKQCQVGVLPLGTGNDLARVLGWGSSCDHDAHLPQLLERYEKACTKMLDRWSIMTYERSISLTDRKMSNVDHATSLHGFEVTVGIHLAKVLEDETSGGSADTRLLTEAVKDLSLRAAELVSGQQEMIEALNKRLSELLRALETPAQQPDVVTLEVPTAKEGGEEKCSLEKQEKDFINTKEKSASSTSLNTVVTPANQEAVETSASSLKDAVRHLVEATERALANRSRHDSVGEAKQRYLDIPGPRRSMDTLKVSPTSGETSPGSNPGFTYLSISPLPDLRRDSTSSAGGEDLSSIPVPTAFADGRCLPDESAGFVPIAPAPVLHPPGGDDDDLTTFIDDTGRLIETFNLLNVNSRGLDRSKESIATADGDELARRLSGMDLKVPGHTAIRPTTAGAGDDVCSKDSEDQTSDTLTVVEKTVRVKDIVDSLRNQEVLRDLKLNSLSSSIDSYKYSLLPDRILEDGDNSLGFAEDCENSLRLLKMKREAEMTRVPQDRGDSLLNVPFFRPGQQSEHFAGGGGGGDRADGGGGVRNEADEEEMVLTSSFDPQRGEFTLKQVPSFESINDNSCDTVEFVCGACASNNNNNNADVSAGSDLLGVDSYMIKSGSIMCLDSDIAHIDSPESSDPTLNSNLALQSEVGDNISMLAESTVFDDSSSMLGINTSILVENGVLADQELSIADTTSNLETYEIVRRMSLLRDNDVATLRAEVDRRMPSGAEELEDEDDDDHEVEMIKGCSLAQFSEGSDIGRRSFYRHVRSPRLKASSKKVAGGGEANDPPTANSSLTLPEIVEDSSKLDETSSDGGGGSRTVKTRNRSCSEGMAIKDDSCLLGHDLIDVINIHIQGSNGNLDSLHSSINMGIDVGGLGSRQPSLGGDYVIKNEPTTTTTATATATEEDHKEFPAMISVVVDPPSPEAHPAPRRRVQLDESIFRRCSTGKLSPSCSVAGFARSPAATRRISNCSLLKPPDGPSLAQRSKSLTDTDHRRQLPIINPLVRLPMWPNVSGAGLISKVLLANADFLCAAASPLMDPDETLMEGYFERSVMNNYFGIGIDAKISLDFHQKREEHPEKCRSRAKNYMWYGVLGSKQWLQKTYKNLEQRVQLECDGQRIPLPSLQGIVILNIPSFMGGTNFWGGKKEDDCFLAPSFDDRILEVVAVFGSVQMAASRLINLQHHRIAQCQTIQITILGDEGVPVEVDGEAWIQPPGMIRIIHKNRMQMLCRNRALETSLKSWEEKQKHSMSSSLQSVSQVQSSQSEERLSPFSEDENQLLLSFIESATTLVKYVKLLTISHPSIEPDLYQLAAATAAHMERVHPGGKIVEGPNLRPQVTDLVSGARQLYEETCSLLRDKGQHLKLREDLEGKLGAALGSTEMELRKCVTYDSVGLVHFQQPVVDEHDGGRRSRAGRGLSWLKFRRCHSSGSRGARDVAAWGVAEVGAWLETLGVPEYAESFTRHDVRGRELLTLSRRDLKELGVTKVGHVKRILQGVKDLSL